MNAYRVSAPPVASPPRASRVGNASVVRWPRRGRPRQFPSSRVPGSAWTPYLGRTGNWPRRYARYLRYSDIAIVALTLVVIGIILPSRGGDYLDIEGAGLVPYWVVLLVIGIVWLVSLSVMDSRNENIVGQGPLEYSRLLHGSIAGFLVVLAVAFFLRADLSRVIFVLGAPMGLLLLLLSRWLWRQWLRGKQRRGEFVHRAVVIGDVAKVRHIISVISRTEGTGYHIVGAVTSHPSNRPTVADVEILGDYGQVAAAVDRVGADTLIVASADDLEPKTMRRLGWSMAERDVEWIVAPAMTDIAGPRIHTRPVAGLPLVHVAFPTMEGSPAFLKRAMDLIGSSVLIVVLSPVILVVALVVKLSSPGPVFYRQERIGQLGKSFGMIKFRSMVLNADHQLQDLLAEQGSQDTPLFKIVNDPRVTPAGGFLRRYSLDELPQLFNVFLGEMSMVGPRPQRPAEVALYDDDAHRRLLVKPGMSGLWQVSGRSSLPWEDALRLDLYYVENWSLAQDFVILFRTLKAVFRPEGTAH